MLETPAYVCYRLVDTSLIFANAATKQLLVEGMKGCR
jgi:hypothetical protein